MAPAALRHRLVLSFDAERQGTTAAAIVATRSAGAARRLTAGAGAAAAGRRHPAPARAPGAAPLTAACSRPLGERRRAPRPRRVELADHRPYIAGDDLRRVDPNVCARLRQLVVGRGRGGRLSLAVLVDASGSMARRPVRAAAARMAATSRGRRAAARGLRRGRGRRRPRRALSAAGRATSDHGPRGTSWSSSPTPITRT